MKHDTRISTDADPAEHAWAEGIRAHLPDPGQCATCHDAERDCTRTSFSEMPVLSIHPDGIAFVDCAQFDPAAPIEEGS